MITKLWLKDFRNFNEVLLNFGEKSNIFIYGENNQGKTNFLESIFFLGNGASHREPKNENLIQFKKSLTYIGLEVDKDEQKHKIYFKILKDGKRLGTFDQQLLNSTQLLKKHLNIEYISSDVIKTFQESPDYRRDVLNRFCGILYSDYTATLQGYNRIIKQKNFQLKNINKKESIDYWNDQLIDYSYKLITMRLKSLVQIEAQTKEFIKPIFSDFYESLNIGYSYHGIPLESFSEATYKQTLKRILNDVFNKEKELGFSIVGAHRDDFFLSIKNKELKRFFSRGINRSLSFFLRLAQIEIISKKTGVKSTLLLDDPFAEIDAKNKSAIINVIDNKCQIFYATIFKSDAQYFNKPFIVKIDTNGVNYG
ncbi:DNA replication/repair protein RecF [bacterium]|jgi:DNA replication and repair protein RecF|nr:DNA replication/repair protein RecF [bacterium]